MAGNTSDRVWGLVAPAVIATVVSLVAAFWSLADPRNEIRRIETDYLQIREHNEFRDRVRQDLERIEQENVRQNKVGLTRHEAMEVWAQRRSELDEMRRRIDALTEALARHERDDRLLDKGKVPIDARPSH